MNAIPVTILGGYLGAGKTTLINRVLATQTDQRLAVFVNDFGEINIDAALIESRDDNVVALTNGCVCCSIGDDLGKALFDLLQGSQTTDHILIEASGAADPSRVAGYASGDGRLDNPTIITLVDVETVRARARDKFVGKLVQRQIKSAHLVATTKTDLVSQDDCVAVDHWITSLVPNTPTIGAIQALPDVLTVASTHAVKVDRTDLPAFKSFLFKSEAPVDTDKLKAVICNLPNTIWRAKGFVQLAGNGPHILQKVGKRVSLAPLEDARNGDTAIVLISTDPNVNVEQILAELSSTAEK